MNGGTRFLTRNTIQSTMFQTGSPCRTRTLGMSNGNVGFAPRNVIGGFMFETGLNMLLSANARLGETSLNRLPRALSTNVPVQSRTDKVLREV